jgi:hypothetical protein
MLEELIDSSGSSVAVVRRCGDALPHLGQNFDLSPSAFPQYGQNLVITEWSGVRGQDSGVSESRFNQLFQISDDVLLTPESRPLTPD